MAGSKRKKYHTPEGLRIGACKFFPELHRLETPDGQRRLSPKSSEVLALLAAQPGRVLRRDEIIRQVWEGRFPTDDVLTHAITDLRRALEDDPAAPRYIETIPKVGYRLLEAAEPEPVSRGRRQRYAAVVVLVLAGVIGALSWYGEHGAHGPVESPESDGAAVAQEEIPVQPVRIRAGYMLIETPDAMEWEAAADADGERIVYARRLNGERDLWLLERTTGRQLPLVTTPRADEAYPVWSPAGDQIAFRSTVGGACEIRRYRLDGGEISSVFEGCHAGTTLDWSPDGRWIAFTAPAGDDAANLRNLAIYRVSPTGGEAERLTFSPTATRHDVHPRFSADGTRLAFIRTGRESERLLMVQPAEQTGAAVPVVTDSWVTSLDWHGNEYIFMTAHRDKLHQLEVLDLPSRRVFGLGPSGLADVSVAGDELLVHPFAASYRIEWMGGEGTGVVAESEGYNFHPAPSPDHRRLAFNSTRSGRAELYVKDLGADAEPRQLTERPGAGPAHPRWHPDGRHLAFLLHNDKGSRIAIADTAAATVNVFPVLRAGSMLDIDWSPDGNALYVTANRTQSWELWRVDGQTGVTEQLTTGGADYFSVDLDGRIYYTRPGDETLNVLSTEGEREVLGVVIPRSSPSSWLVRNGEIHVVSATEPPQWEHHTLGSGIRRLELPASRANLALSPDGDRVYFEQGGPTRADIQVLELDWR